MTHAPASLTHYVGFSVRQAQQLHAALWQREAASDITSVQFGAILLLHNHPGIDQQTLGSHLNLDRSTIADVCSRLARHGYLTRERDLVDGRRNVLKLTNSGERVLAELLPVAQRVNQLLVTHLSTAEQNELRRLLTKILCAPDSATLPES